ncbi:peptidylprolyl isomerase [Deinococcus yavapaiensis]|uniref:peptidylprolyl isomerase n=1 Tax=Deinococcus yavapaiensis KR-236 TaxID=694435 RepID=A0A318SLD7_9DEIO|nr:peptidylprolyl isomerase [Deinococcus yavapaiensis]PYE53362.1 peptidyl-prolyl cis-trans isomerase C [Deinococcus yavapaiensis KR-236]
MNQKVIVRVLLGVLALLLVAGLAVQVPGISNFSFSRNQGTPALRVNGQTVTAEELDRVRQGNQVLSSVREGALGEDFKTVVVDQKVQQVLLAQAAKDIDIKRADVNEEVRKIREQNNLTENKAWTDALSRFGYTDASFRDETRTQLAIQKKLEQIRASAAKPTDAEVQLYYDLNPDAFKTEPRVVGRQIVVSDQKKAQALLKQAQGGADFAKLASENSLEGKDKGGALGDVENGKPRPVAAVALPQEVATAAFALTKGGLTDVVKSGDRYYIVKVEQYLPAGTRSFSEARADAEKAVADQKKNAALETWFDGVVKNAKVEVLDKSWDYFDPTVATVNGQNIRYATVVGTIAANPQISQVLAQGEQATQFINGFFKPSVVQSLIEQYAAPTIVKNLKVPLAGSRGELLQGLQAYGARDVKVTDAEIRAEYEKQKANYATPASANVSEAVFADRAKATAFRDSLIGKSVTTFTTLASKAGGTVAERGAVTQGDGKLGTEIDAAVFGAKAKLAGVGEGSVTDVVQTGNRYSIGFVKDLVKASTKSFDEVREELRSQLLQQKRQTTGQTFVTAQLKSFKVQNNLQKVVADLDKRAAANAPKTPAGQTNATPQNGSSDTNTNSGTGTTSNDGTKQP